MPRLYADQAKFKQILFNLLSNAIKFSPKGGEVRIVVECDGDAASVEVIAHHFGIDDDRLRELHRG